MKKVIVLLVMLGLALVGCDESSNEAEEAQTEATEELQREAFRQVGMPDIVNFQELRFAKQIQELRDMEVTTYTYTVDEQGGLHFVCQSVGYGLPYSTQMTNPEREERVYNGAIALPQPEPNGLYMPDNVDATWVLCLDESEGDVDPIYSEPRLLVSPFRLNSEDSYYDAQAQASEATPGLSAGSGQ